MKTFLVTCAAIAAVTSPALAQMGPSEIRDGVRYLTPKEESRQTDEANLIQSRAIEMGFFSWPVPTGKVEADPVGRPAQVSSCEGHDPAYRPAHDFSADDEWSLRSEGQAKAFLYEWMAYGNAIEAGDCSCATLRADWSEAVAAFDTLLDGIDNHRLYTFIPSRMRDGIKRDYDQMCDVRMRLDLE